MARPNLLTATFRATTYKTSQGFAFPELLFQAFGFGKGSEVALLVQTPGGDTLYCGPSKFISGPEVTEARASRNLPRGKDVIVTASRAAALPSRSKRRK